jgi:hypothetical protein
VKLLTQSLTDEETTIATPKSTGDIYEPTTPESVDSPSSEDIIPMSSRRRLRNTNVVKEPPVTPKRSVSIERSPLTRRMTRAGAPRERHAVLTPQAPRGFLNSISSDIGEPESSNDEDLTVPGRKPKSARVYQRGGLPLDTGQWIVDDTEESDSASPRKLRRTSANKKSPVKDTKASPKKRTLCPQDRRELQDDVEDLRDSGKLLICRPFRILMSCRTERHSNTKST